MAGASKGKEEGKSECMRHARGAREKGKGKLPFPLFPSRD